MPKDITINGVNILDHYGCILDYGGFEEIASFAPLKPVKYNDWHEEDGIEVDLSAPRLDAKECDIKFVVLGGVERYKRFIDFLMSTPYLLFRFGDFDRSCRLRYLSVDRVDTRYDMTFLDVKFSDDFPLDGYRYQPPSSTLESYDDYTFDGRPFTDYGVRILQGSLDSIVKASGVKHNLTRDISTQDGVWYDGQGPVTLHTRDATLRCLMRAQSLTELWRNADALLYDLVRPEERTLHVKKLNKDYSFMYKSSRTAYLIPYGKIWFEFDLTITILR